MPAKVVALPCKVGEKVASGTLLAMLEAMKMEYPLYAPFDGTVTAIHTEVGAQVLLGAKIVELK